MGTHQSDPSRPHIPVLLASVLDTLASQNVRLVVDCTLGAAGHASALLAACPEARLVALDADPEALDLAESVLSKAGCRDRVKLVHARFGDVATALESAGEAPGSVDALLADLGVSSMQIDRAYRGFSFQQEGPLDMRMQEGGESALDLLRRLNEQEIARIIWEFGEERLSRKIARFIKEAIDDATLQTTIDLREICRRAYPRGPQRIDPATRTFQALRIAVNDELGELERLLASIPKVMSQGGCVGIISFHSLEDRMVKNAFKAFAEAGHAEILTKKPLTADQDECARNPRSRSAKYRVLRWRRQA